MSASRHQSSLTVVGQPKPKGKGNVAGIPLDAKDLRACMICSLIKSHGQFEQDGCENCDGMLNLAGRAGSAYSYTSTSFEGMISLMEPSTSWVAKWQHISTLKVGIYAVSVRGELPHSLMQELLESGLRYRCRDKGLTAEDLAQREREQNGENAEEEERRIRKSRRNRRRRNKKQSQPSRVSESSEFPESQSQESRVDVDHEQETETQAGAESAAEDDDDIDLDTSTQ